MVVVETVAKPAVKVSVSDTDSSSESEESIEETQAEDQNEESDRETQAEDQNEESDRESASSDDGSEPENDLLITNEGWADSVAKILGASKPKNKKTLVLSRAKKHSEIVKKEAEEKPAFEIIGEQGELKPDVKELVKKEDATGEPVAKKPKHEKSSIRVKPNILEKDRERLLSKIATKGVVQLFNAVRNQQKTLEKEISDDIPEHKKERLLKKFDKRSFLDTLMGPTKSVVVDEVKSLKNDVKKEEKPRWSALRDDFMTGAKMKDWDKESVDE